MTGSGRISPQLSRRRPARRSQVKVLVDPSVVGGVVAKIGDTVIDGTVRRRLEQLKEQVSG